ncbi:MAG: hypothetical protein R2795_04205 [Saprospiraceae bacterium]
MLAFCLFLVISRTASGQNTIGLTTVAPTESLGGYTLIYPNYQSKVWLLDACGQVVHVWDDLSPGAVPGVVAYLREDGLLLRPN